MAESRNIKICQTAVVEQTKQIKEDYQYKKVGDAFQSLAYSLLFNTDYDEIPLSEIVDGKEEKQMDIIRIEEDEDNQLATIHIIQAKFETGFSSNTVVLISNGLSWLFERGQEEYKKLKNETLVYKIDEIRKLGRQYTHDGLSVNVYFVTNGDTTDLSKEFEDERNNLLARFAPNFGEFNFRAIGAFELTELTDQIHRSKRKVSLDIKILSDIHKCSYIEHFTEDTKAIICTVTGTELARIASSEPRDAIFDMNVRPFYGSRGKVNSQILESCTKEDSSYFWFLNNGITMVCDEATLTPIPGEAFVRVKNAQIVNGCQTSVSIREASEKKLLQDNVKVLLKIYSTRKEDLASKITLSTNNQNKITDRDLRANEPVQKLIQKEIKDRFGYLYERKNKEYQRVPKKEKINIISNEKVGQACLAVIKRKPSQARGYLLKLWSTYYKDVFESSLVEEMLLSYLIYKYYLLKSKVMKSNTKGIDTTMLVYGAFHLSRITGSLLTHDKWGIDNRDQIIKHIKEIEKNPDYLKPYYSKSMKILKSIWNKKASETGKNPSLFFKAGTAEIEIEKALGSTKKGADAS